MASIRISKDHFKAGKVRKTYSDSDQKGFALRTTPNGVFTFYYQYLNKNKLHPKTRKPMREWIKIGDHGPEWSIDKARKEATRLAGLVAADKSIKIDRQQKIERSRAGGVTFGQLHDEYIAYCSELMQRRWGVVPRKESWKQIEYALSRPLKKWAKRVANEITPADTYELYKMYVKEGHPAQANGVRGDLRTMFNWGMNDKRKYVAVNPCPPLDEDEKAIEQRDLEDGRTLGPDELRAFWFGLDDPKCPGDRYSKLALKLTLVTALRSGEIVKIPREGVAPDTVTIPLKFVKGRRSKKARPVTQPLNSLAREILGEVFSIGNPDREYAFPAFRNQGLIFRPDRPRLKCINTKHREKHMSQQTLSCLMTRRSRGKNGRGGINEFLGLGSDKDRITPHDLRRTAASILEQLGFDDGLIGKVMTHKATGKDESPVTRAVYLVSKPIIARPVDPRIGALDALDTALREILALPKAKKLPPPVKMLKAA